MCGMTTGCFWCCFYIWLCKSNSTQPYTDLYNPRSAILRMFSHTHTVVMSRVIKATVIESEANKKKRVLPLKKEINSSHFIIISGGFV